MNVDILNCEMEMCEEKVVSLLKHDDRSTKKPSGKKSFPCYTPTSMSENNQSGTDTQVHVILVERAHGNFFLHSQ